MTTIGKVSVAPCGHKGETIIGTYVKCLVGCDSQAKPAPTPVKTFDPNKMIIAFKGQTLSPVSGAPVAYAQPQMSTVSGLEAAALSVKGVTRVDVIQAGTGVVYVDILRYDPGVNTDPNWKSLMTQLSKDVQDAVRNACAMGVLVSVVDRSPMFCLDYYASQLAVYVKSGALKNVADYYNFMMKNLLGEKYTNQDLSTLRVSAVGGQVTVSWYFEGQDLKAQFTP